MGHIDVTERLGEEVVDQLATFVGVHVGGAGHQSKSFLGSATCDSAQDGLVGPQSANLRLQGLDVCGRLLCETLLTIQDGPDFAEPHAQVAQGAGQLQPGYAVCVITAVATGGPADRCHDAHIRPVPDHFDRQPGLPCDGTDVPRGP
ncbi:hypothetical protein JHY03_00470 [Streptomyces sp. CA-256286]|nr:hypothetical protein JHY03_00470 [Streptomyces sp. CA-256286]